MVGGVVTSPASAGTTGTLSSEPSGLPLLDPPCGCPGGTDVAEPAAVATTAPTGATCEFVVECSIHEPALSSVAIAGNVVAVEPVSD